MLKFKLTALITGIACTLASIHIPIVSAETKPTETIHNIVVFAQFQDTDSYNFMEDRVQEIQDMCEDRSTVISLAGYIDKISYGQMNVESHYPQLKDGTIIPYVMQMPESSYQNSQQAAAEVLTNIEILIFLLTATMTVILTIPLSYLMRVKRAVTEFFGPAHSNRARYR